MVWIEYFGSDILFGSLAGVSYLIYRIQKRIAKIDSLDRRVERAKKELAGMSEESFLTLPSDQAVCQSLVDVGRLGAAG